MLRLDSRAGFVRGPFDLAAVVLGRYRFVSGRRAIGRRLTRRSAAALVARAEHEPVAVGCEGPVTWWAHRGRYWREDGGYAAADVAALVHERDLRERRRLDRAHALLGAAGQGAPRREGIPRGLRALVWERDGGRCTECGSDRLLEFDHVIPVALGGSSRENNLQLLCADCNRLKADAF